MRRVRFEAEPKKLCAASCDSSFKKLTTAKLFLLARLVIHMNSFWWARHRNCSIHYPPSCILLHSSSGAMKLVFFVPRRLPLFRPQTEQITLKRMEAKRFGEYWFKVGRIPPNFRPTHGFSRVELFVRTFTFVTT